MGMFFDPKDRVLSQSQTFTDACLHVGDFYFPGSGFWDRIRVDQVKASGDGNEVVRAKLEITEEHTPALIYYPEYLLTLALHALSDPYDWERIACVVLALGVKPAVTRSRGNLALILERSGDQRGTAARFFSISAVSWHARVFAIAP